MIKRTINFTDDSRVNMITYLHEEQSAPLRNARVLRMRKV